MKRICGLLLTGVTVSLAVAACSSQPPAAPPSPQATSAVQYKPAWQEEWDKTVAAAKKEGRVAVINRLPENVRQGLAAAFKDKYGLDIDFSVGTTMEFWPKIEAERRTGMYLRDVAMDGATALTGTVAAAGAAESMERAIILPEVKDAANWRDKRLPFYDKNGQILMYISRVAPTLVINKEQTKPEEFKSWRNLLDPKWKGKILMFDPTIPGPGNSIIATIGDLMGMDYLRELAKQEPVVNRDMRMQVEWIARNKYPVGLGFEFTLMEELRGAGAPLVHVVPAEGTYFGSAFGSMVMFEKAANPNATRVFINWFLSKEGQALFARTAKEQSRRADLTPEMAPDRLFQEGMKYIDFDTEDMFNKRTEMVKLSKEIFGLK